jgi:D-serine dehydratase
VRSGCYVSHDAGFYAMHASHAQQRRAVGAVPELQSALEVWTQVLSRPEPELAILNAGKRDVSFDIHLPFAQAWFRAGMHAPRPLQGCSVSKLSDQHAFLRVPEASELRVGDFVALSISHPCTTFDKWPLLLEVDDDYTVVEGLRTFF